MYATEEFREEIQIFLSIPAQIHGEDTDIAAALYDLNTASSRAISSSVPADKKKMTPKERKEDLRKKVTEIVDTFRTSPEKIAEYLIFASRFNQYSHKNLRLIYCQDPHASFVESASFFKKGMPGRDGVPLTDKKIYIKKGERALYVWAPKETPYVLHPDFKKYLTLSELNEETKQRAINEKWKHGTFTSFFLVPVFDISQTDCPREIYPKVFGFIGKEHPSLDISFKALCDYLKEELNCTVTVCDLKHLKTSVRGFYSPEDNSIKLSDMLSGDELLSTAVHEAAHAELHRNAQNRSTSQIELEADMFALMLHEKMGIEVTDSRKSHLAQHYNAYIERLRESLPKGEDLDLSADSAVFNNVISQYRKQSPIIDKYISRYKNELNVTSEREIEAPSSISHSASAASTIQKKPYGHKL